MRRLLVLTAVAAAAGVVAPAALAHANLVATSPRDGEVLDDARRPRCRIRFDDAVKVGPGERGRPERRRLGARRPAAGRGRGPHARAAGACRAQRGLQRPLARDLRRRPPRVGGAGLPRRRGRRRTAALRLRRGGHGAGRARARLALALPGRHPRRGRDGALPAPRHVAGNAPRRGDVRGRALRGRGRRARAPPRDAGGRHALRRRHRRGDRARRYRRGDGAAGADPPARAPARGRRLGGIAAGTVALGPRPRRGAPAGPDGHARPRPRRHRRVLGRWPAAARAAAPDRRGDRRRAPLLGPRAAGRRRAGAVGRRPGAHRARRRLAALDDGLRPHAAREDRALRLPARARLPRPAATRLGDAAAPERLRRARARRSRSSARWRCSPRSGPAATPWPPNRPRPRRRWRSRRLRPAAGSCSRSSRGGSRSGSRCGPGARSA